MGDDLRQRYDDVLDWHLRPYLRLMSSRNILVKQILASLDGVRDAELERLRGLVADYETATAWNITCTGCAEHLDNTYALTARAEQAEAIVARVRRVADAYDHLAGLTADTEADGRAWAVQLHEHLMTALDGSREDHSG